MAKTEVRLNLNFPKFVLQPELEKVAERVIRVDIQNRMNKGIDINGSPHRENTTSTRLQKSLRGLRTNVPLVASGQLRKSFRINLIGKDRVKIFPAGTRTPYPPIKRKYRLKKKKRSQGSKQTLLNNELADILQNKGVKNTGHKYEFFGISDSAEKGALKWMISYINKEIKLGRRKTIRRI